MTVFTDSGTNLIALAPSKTYLCDTKISSGKYYFEFKIKNSTSNLFLVGVANQSVSLNSYLGSDLNGWGYYAKDGMKYNSSYVAYGNLYTTNDVIGIAIDMDNKTLQFYKNGIAQGIAFTNLSGQISPSVGASAMDVASVEIEGLFDKNSIIYPIPNGFSPLDSNKKILLSSGDKTYSLDSEEQKYNLAMTSNVLPSPYVASASSVYNTSYYSAWKAFNGTNSANTDSWITANGVLTGWIQLDFGKKTPVTKVFITSRVGSGGEKVAPKDFNIEGSNDNVNFDVIQSFKGVTDWKADTTKEFNIRKREYRYYRLNILANNGDGSYSGVGKLEFYYKGSDLIKLPQSNKENFVNYGFSSPSQFNNIITNKNYILQDTVSEDADGLWKQELNRKPLSIKFE